MSIAVQPTELVITRETWDTALRPLLHEPGAVAIGGLRWNTAATSRELLVDRLDLVHTLPSGADRPPLDDWVVFRVEATVQGAESSAEFIKRLRPRASQTLVVVTLLRGQDQQAWDGALFEDGNVLPLSGLRVVGPAPLTLGCETENDLSPAPVELARWSRTAGALGRPLLDRVRRSTVTLIGAGRSGSMLAFQLAALGVSRLRLIDEQTLGIENLDAMPGLTVADVGKFKATALGERLLAFRPDLTVTCFEKSMTDRDVSTSLRAQRSDLIVTCVDRDLPRLMASLLSRQTLTPHLDVATSIQPVEENEDERTMAGDVRLLLPGAGGGCVACVGGLQDADETLYELSAPAGALQRGRPQAWHEERAGSLITLNSMAVGIAGQIWLDVLAGKLRTSHWHRLRWLAGSGLETDYGAVGTADGCLFCRRELGAA